MRILARYLLALAALAALAVALNVYINTYSLHVFVRADYAGFEAPPGPDGTVRIGDEVIDFRFPWLSFSPASRERIRRELALADGASGLAIARTVTDYVRSNLNARDSDLPLVSEQRAEAILTAGRERQSQCGEHARLFTAVMQLFGLQARMLWLEGHVAAEYFDRDAGSWVYVDPHLGVCFADESGARLSAAKAIRRLAADEFLEIAVLSEAGERAVTWREVEQQNPTYYRNLLLNGELVAYAGSVLVESGRWTHLLRHGKRPQVLVLTTDFDRSATRYVEPVTLRSIVVTSVALWLGFAVIWFLVRPVARGAAWAAAVDQIDDISPRHDDWGRGGGQRAEAPQQRAPAEVGGRSSPWFAER